MKANGAPAPEATADAGTAGLAAAQHLGTPIVTRHVADDVVDRLVTAVALGLYVTGQQLPTERELASMLGVSRTSVREALKQLTDAFEELAYLPLGGAGLRGYGPDLAFDRVVATNLEARRRLTRPFGSARGIAVWGSAFADLAAGSVDADLIGSGQTFFADVGPGISLRGRFYDRDVVLRLDLPLYGYQVRRSAPSLLVTFNDLW